jgi:hypothetical protein
VSCAICEKRKAKRYCPAKDGKICAVCCGTEREVTIDCPGDCPYLVAARRYEEEHRKPLPPEEVPYPEVEITGELVHERRAVVSGLAYHALKTAAEQPSLTDADVLEALGAVAETFRTLSTGIYYEKPPDAPLPRQVYEELAHFLDEAKKQAAEHTGFSTLKDSDIFHLLVFLLRVGRHRTNGRPKSRAYLDFLRAQFPHSAELQRAAPKIILP